MLEGERNTSSVTSIPRPEFDMQAEILSVVAVPTAFAADFVEGEVKNSFAWTAESGTL